MKYPKLKAHLMRFALPTLILFYICSCSSGTSSTSSDYWDTAPEKTKEVLVFCDLSSSLSKREANKLQNCTASILNSLPVNGYVRFYEITEQAANSFFDYHRLEVKGDHKNIRENLLTESILDTAEYLSKIILDRFEKNKELNSQKLNSCILNALYLADKAFRLKWEIDTSKTDYTLIIISDMIEQCENSPVGKLNMRLGKREDLNNKFERLTSILKNYSPPYNLSYANVKVIKLVKENQDNQLPLQQERFEAMWIDIFSKAGFKNGFEKDWHFIEDCLGSF